MPLRNFLKCISIIFLISCNESIKHYEAAYKFYNNKNYKDALTEIDKAEKSESTNLDYKFLKSKIYQSLNQWNEALVLLTDLIKSKYKLDSVYHAIGAANFYFSTELYKINPQDKRSDSILETSIKYLDSAISINKYYFDCYELKYKSLHNSSRYEEALSFLNQSIRIFKDSAQLELYRGVEKNMLGDYNGAILDLQKLIFDRRLNKNI